MLRQAIQNAEQWSYGACFDPKTRDEAAALLAALGLNLDNAKAASELEARFGRELTFGTGGLRGVLGVGTNRMNRYTVAKATAGLAAYIKMTGAKDAAVAIGYDSRLGSAEFARVTANVLAANGIRSWLFSRLSPTPLLSFATRELGCRAGVMITASHNPAIYNGYKVYGADGCQITDAAAAAITDEIHKVHYDALPSMDDGWDAYIDAVPEAVYNAFEAKTLSCRARPDIRTPITVCYTPLNGTGLEMVRRVLHAMPGVTVCEVAEQLAPDGHFPTIPKPNPELPETLELGIQTAKRANAAVLLATDPDCDRVGVAAREKDGTYRILTGNEVGLLMLEHLLSSRRDNGTLPERPVVIKTIVTSDLAFAIAGAYGAEVCETLTGFKYIGEEIGRLEARGQGERFVFGFEESCGYLAGTHVRDKDGVQAAMLICEITQALAARGQTLTEALEALNERYGRILGRLLNFDISGADLMDVTRKLMDRLRANPPKALGGERLEACVDYLPGFGGLPKGDVLAYVGKRGKTIVRPSGTEPKLKVYLSAAGARDADALLLLDALENDTRCMIEDGSSKQ